MIIAVIFFHASFCSSTSAEKSSSSFLSTIDRSWLTCGSTTFAKYALKILNKLKIDELCFGSEDDDIEKILKVANTQINNKEFDNKVKEYLDNGINYPTALNNALKDLIQIEITIGDTAYEW